MDVSGTAEKSPSSDPPSPSPIGRIGRSLSEPDLEALSNELNMNWISKRESRNKTSRYSKIEEKRIQQLEAVSLKFIFFFLSLFLFLFLFYFYSKLLISKIFDNQ